MSTPRALSPLDSAFLHIESARTPMHIGSVGIFEGSALHNPQGHLRLDEIRARIAERLDLVPKLRRHLQGAVLPGAPPVWTDDLHFDIANHVEATTLASPGEDHQLWDLCGQLFAQPLDRSRPLWHLCVVDGLADGRVAVIERIHHAMADGLAGVEMATLLFDFEPYSSQSVPRTPATTAWQPEEAPWCGVGALQDLVRVGEVGGRWAVQGLRATSHPATTLRGATRLVGAVAPMLGAGLIRPSASLNRPISGNRRVLVLRQPFDLLRRAAHIHGVSVNDLLLTAVGGGVARLLEERGVKPPTDIQVCVPVGLEPGDRHSLGNQVSAWFVRVPVGTMAPAERLLSVSRSTWNARTHREELAAEVLLDLLAPLPQPVVACLGNLANHQPLFNMIVTNVPGPQAPLNLLGAQMLEAYPFVPLGGNLTLGVAALSYDGYLSLGVLTDPTVCPDASIFVAGVQEELATLVEPTRPGP